MTTLSLLPQDYHDQLVRIAGEKEVLNSRGQRLMRASSDIRASDIEQKLARLADRWQHLQDLTASRYKVLVILKYNVVMNIRKYKHLFLVKYFALRHKALK